MSTVATATPSAAAAQEQKARAEHSDFCGAQNNKAAEVKLEKLARRERAVRLLLDERNALKFSVGELRNKVTELEAANAELTEKAGKGFFGLGGGKGGAAKGG